MVVTRFAPSPTGYLHIGGARTALFCWLWARHCNGRMILRIEDTDQRRNTPTAMQQVMDDLHWLGIDWDEGPDIGGPNGPYLQSQRRDIYNEYLRRLLESGKAYYCFDTAEELELLRQKAQARKETFIYPRPEHFPDEAEMKKAQAEGRPVVIRFAVPPLENVVVNDVVRGTVTFSAEQLSDFIIRKSDGFPTYHFACVVDDELMGVTHIIRGQEHLMNTPNHLLLQQALGFSTPSYAHMSVTISEGGGKLSKRDRAKTLRQAINTRPNIDKGELAQAGSLTTEQLDEFLAGKSNPDAPQISAMAEYLGVHLPEINVVDFFKSGYLPDALVNFIALLGWSTGDNREIMSREELIEAFDIQRLTKTNSLFDRKKLIAFNTEHYRRLDSRLRLKYFRQYLQVNNSPLLESNDKLLEKLLLINEGARTFEDVVRKCLFLYSGKVEYDPKAIKKVMQKSAAVDLLAQMRAILAGVEAWDKQTLQQKINAFCESNNIGMGKIAQPLRVAITGSTISPPIDETLLLLGKEKTLQRIDNLLKFLQNARRKD